MPKLAPLLAVLTAILMTISNNAQTPRELAAIWDETHLSTIQPSNVRHRDLRDYLARLEKSGVKMREVGRSFDNREIFEMEWGRGPVRVFMWSQMHGDEPTATSALVDMFNFLQTNGNRKWVADLAAKFTIRAVPMLNPDGAEIYQRRNSQGIDINRDARNLATPEGRLLKQLRDEWKPEIGFNLHNQNALTTVGESTRQASISFLAVNGDPLARSTPGWERNKRLIVGMTNALNEFIPGHVGRYDDEYTESAFGDNFSAWGTPVILVETGALHGRDELFLVKMNFVAYFTALRALADGSEARLKASDYELIPENSSGRIAYFVFRGGTVVNFADAQPTPFVADIAVNLERRRAALTAPTFVRDVGGLPTLAGLDEYDATGYFVVPRSGRLRVGEPGEFLFYKKTRTVDFKAPEFEKKNPPDAVFSLGKWLSGSLPKR